MPRAHGEVGGVVARLLLLQAGVDLAALGLRVADGEVVLVLVLLDEVTASPGAQDEVGADDGDGPGRGALW
jgi:hypothetical protein